MGGKVIGWTTFMVSAALLAAAGWWEFGVEDNRVQDIQQDGIVVQHPNKIRRMSVEDTWQMVLGAVGGEEALASINTWKIEASGRTWYGFEGEHPTDLIPTSSYENVYWQDLKNEKLRVDSIKTPFFEVFQFAEPQVYSRVIDGQVGGMSTPSLFIAGGTLSQQVVAALTRQQMLFNPHILLLKAMENLPVAVDEGISDREQSDDVTVLVITTNVSPIRLHVDTSTGFIKKAFMKESHPVLGDTHLEIRYKDWSIEAETDVTNSEHVVFPRRVVVLGQDGKLWDERRSSVEINPPSLPDAAFDLPAGTDSRSFNMDGYKFGLESHHVVEGMFSVGIDFPSAPAISETVEVAPGVHLVPAPAGANSLIVEYSEGLVLQEAPGSDLHGNNLLKTAETMAPDAEIQYIIQSHHHVDHAGAVRTIVDNGANLVVGHGIKDLWSRVLSKTRRMRPVKNNRSSPLEIMEVEELGSLVLIDEPDLVLTVYHTELDPHCADATITVIETNGEVLVYESDFYNAGTGLTLVVGGPPALFDLLRELGIVMEDCSTEVPTKIIPAHGVILTVEESIAELNGLGVDVGCP